MSKMERSFSTLERYELKFHFPTARIPELVQFLKPWCGLDAHSERSADLTYWVTSLYLDSPQRTFYTWKKEQIPERFNMRIRTYGEYPTHDSVRFFEVKYKAQDVVNKSRGTLPHGDAGLLWRNPTEAMQGLPPSDQKNLAKFYRLSVTYNAHPVLLTQYKRIAWFGLFEDYARVTIDHGMRWRPEIGYDYSIHPHQMRPSDLPEYFEPGTDSVIELKCPKNQVPWWMLDLIQEFNLVRRSFSKFGAASREELKILPDSRTVSTRN